jgi:hypothetical protein
LVSVDCREMILKKDIAHAADFDERYQKMRVWEDAS